MCLCCCLRGMLYDYIIAHLFTSQAWIRVKLCKNWEGGGGGRFQSQGGTMSKKPTLDPSYPSSRRKEVSTPHLAPPDASTLPPTQSTFPFHSAPWPIPLCTPPPPPTTTTHTPQGQIQEGMGASIFLNLLRGSGCGF